jgi:hypothetical protein
MIVIPLIGHSLIRRLLLSLYGFLVPCSDVASRRFCAVLWYFYRIIFAGTNHEM